LLRSAHTPLDREEGAAAPLLVENWGRLIAKSLTWNDMRPWNLMPAGPALLRRQNLERASRVAVVKLSESVRVPSILDWMSRRCSPVNNISKWRILKCSQSHSKLIHISHFTAVSLNRPAMINLESHHW
jgi:hypothetical protein